MSCALLPTVVIQVGRRHTSSDFAIQTSAAGKEAGVSCPTCVTAELNSGNSALSCIVYSFRISGQTI